MSDLDIKKRQTSATHILSQSKQNFPKIPQKDIFLCQSKNPLTVDNN